MPGFSQNDSPLRLSTPLPENTLLPVRLSARERLGEPFSFVVEMVSSRGTTIPFDQLIGHPASVLAILPGAVERYFHGEIWSFSSGDSDAVFDHHTLELRPRLSKLGLARRSRVFHDKTAVEILTILAKEAGEIVTCNLRWPQPVRLCCTQYRETDLEFFLRLCSESGIVAFWVHTASDHSLFLTDSTSHYHKEIQSLHYDTNKGTRPKHPRADSWRVTQKRCPKSAAVFDSHFQLYKQPIGSISTVPVTIRAGVLNLHSVDWATPWHEDGHSPARCFDSVGFGGEEREQSLAGVYSAQENQARILATGVASGSVRAEITGDCCHLAPGHSFLLNGHPNQSGSWLVVETHHDLQLDGRYYAGEAHPFLVETRALAAPLNLDQAIWPPVQRPKVGGVQTAIVIGSEANEPTVDKFGRIHIQFWWDQEKHLNSCWVRVAQAWAGNNWGSCFWPRVGNEVVVAFEDGDPDRPVVVGCLYNGSNMPPYALPANKYIAGWKSLSQGGDPAHNFHQILMSDEKGLEIVHIHAEGSVVVHQEESEFRRTHQHDIHLQG